ncbi:O-succinylbenzoate synthase [Paenibacillus sp. UNCCL117]|uniref:o-succinylbenzoate synthase n=1 Tax=unclassified Paenibacillus TaxID=185978 RepID=UPI00088E8EF2|nr:MULTISPECIES: o-succinylbenzoate synthase [unclassified Paenibacillus]SDD05087.1 O-succinylbenzoate synthase [Paenibacillus sp. cl123]SFW31942.1 O-succinylbenzoate synthase [Paenibacillus sp. UNCCL117]
MKIDRITLRQVQVPLKAPFETSFGRMSKKECVIVAVHSDGCVGYGESVAFSHPYYNEETTETIWYMLEHYLVPSLVGKEVTRPEEVSELFASIRRNHMAIASIETAVWDLYAKRNGISLAQALGGGRQEIEVGVSIGIEPTTAHVVRNVERFVEQGYRRMKVKIKPGFDIELVQAIRKRFGDELPLMVDANSAYTLKDMPILKELDRYNLMMIEQPLAHDDIIEHAALQKELRTPICLDESIHTLADASHAIDLGSCRIMNIKIGRVGGFTNAKRIHDLCSQRGIPVWCGGMLELGIGRLHNVAISSLSNFSIPGDVSASDRFWEQDIVVPGIELVRPGVLAVPANAGIGHEVCEETLERFTTRKLQSDRLSAGTREV